MRSFSHGYRRVPVRVSTCPSTRCRVHRRLGRPCHARRMAATDRIVVYTDGACSGNPGPGGWAWAIAPDGQRSGSGGETSTTNQRMELMAVLEAVRSLADEVVEIHVVSDSTYVV